MTQERRADEYRRMAKECFEIAARMSVKEDRTRVLDMARRWLNLAIQVRGQEEERGPE
jgi:hypothetical protein